MVSPFVSQPSFELPVGCEAEFGEKRILVLRDDVEAMGVDHGVVSKDMIHARAEIPTAKLYWSFARVVQFDEFDQVPCRRRGLYGAR